MSAKAASSQVVEPHRLKWHGELAVAGACTLLRGLAATWRFHFLDDGWEREVEPGPVIFAVWHNRLALTMPIHRNVLLGRQPHRRLATLVSASKDGAMLARFMEHYGVQPVRGSTSRRGPQALLEMARVARRGYDLAVTPDGPRGPKYEVQPGVVQLARVSGHPIVPVSAQIFSRKELRSWDAFQVPLPFARCEIQVGESVRVARDADEAVLEEARATVERRLRDLTID